MTTTLRFERAITYVDAITELDSTGVKFFLRNERGVKEFGDFCKSDCYVVAELIAEYQPNFVSLGFYQSSVYGDSEFFDACKEAAQAAGIEFICTAG